MDQGGDTDQGGDSDQGGDMDQGGDTDQGGDSDQGTETVERSIGLSSTSIGRAAVAGHRRKIAISCPGQPHPILG